MRATALVFRFIERREQRRQIIDNALELHFDAMHELVAMAAIPFESIDRTWRALSFDHKARAARLRTLWRMTQMR